LIYNDKTQICDIFVTSFFPPICSIFSKNDETASKNVIDSKSGLTIKLSDTKASSSVLHFDETSAARPNSTQASNRI